MIYNVTDRLMDRQRDDMQYQDHALHYSVSRSKNCMMWTFDLSVNACQASAMHNMPTKFGAGSSNSFL